jgi:hypothetical protein
MIQMFEQRGFPSLGDDGYSLTGTSFEPGRDARRSMPRGREIRGLKHQDRCAGKHSQLPKVPRKSGV